MQCCVAVENVFLFSKRIFSSFEFISYKLQIIYFYQNFLESVNFYAGHRNPNKKSLKN